MALLSVSIKFVASIAFAFNMSSISFITVPAGIIFLLLETIELAILSHRLSVSGTRVPSILIEAKLIGGPFGLVKAFLRFRSQIIIAEDLSHYKFLHVRIAVSACWFAFAGIGLALQSRDYNDFARVGALIALAGLYSTFVGLKHDFAYTQSFELMGDSVLTETASKAERGRGPQHLATMAMYLVTISGTLIWAYGDIFLSKIMANYPNKTPVNVADQSNAPTVNISINLESPIMVIPEFTFAREFSFTAKHDQSLPKSLAIHHLPQ